MSLLPYALARRALLALDPEVAHELTLHSLAKIQRTPLEWAYCNARGDDSITLAGLVFRVYPHADYVTVNISSPNTQNLRTLQSDEALDALLSAIAAKRKTLAKTHRKQVPIFVKIAPDLDEGQVKVIATTLLRHGMDGDGLPNNAFGVVATNTTLSRDAVKGLPHSDEAGGLSGAPVLAMSNGVITQLRAALGKSFPIIGVGGILSAADTLGKIKAGADMVQIYTGLIYQGPALVRDAAELIKKAMGSKTAG